MFKFWLEVEYRLIAAILFLVGSIPIRFRSALGYRIGYFLAPFFRREFAVAREQLSRFLKDPTPELTARKVFGHTGRLLLEGINIAPLLRSAEVRTSDDALVAEAAKGERGMVVLTAHLSSWDLLAAAMNERGVKVATVARRMRRSSVQRILERFRNRLGVECLWRDKRSDAAKIRRHLENRGVITALVDQDTNVRSEFVPFFGVPAAVPVSLLALGKKNQCANSACPDG